MESHTAGLTHVVRKTIFNGDYVSEIVTLKKCGKTRVVSNENKQI